MPERSALFALMSALLLAGCSHTMGRADHIEVEQTPPAVIEGFHREFPGITLSHTDKITYLNNTVNYELKFRDANHDYFRKLFSADGKLLDSKRDVALPAQTQPAKV